jgi:hypothetical protein
MRREHITQGCTFFFSKSPGATSKFRRQKRWHEPSFILKT